MVLRSMASVVANGWRSCSDAENAMMMIHKTVGSLAEMLAICDYADLLDKVENRANQHRKLLAGG